MKPNHKALLILVAAFWKWLLLLAVALGAIAYLLIRLGLLLAHLASLFIHNTHLAWQAIVYVILIQLLRRVIIGLREFTFVNRRDTSWNSQARTYERSLIEAKTYAYLVMAVCYAGSPKEFHDAAGRLVGERFRNTKPWFRVWPGGLYWRLVRTKDKPRDLWPGDPFGKPLTAWRFQYVRHKLGAFTILQTRLIYEVLLYRTAIMIWTNGDVTIAARLLSKLLQVEVYGRSSTWEIALNDICKSEAATPRLIADLEAAKKSRGKQRQMTVLTYARAAIPTRNDMDMLLVSSFYELGDQAIESYGGYKGDGFVYFTHPADRYASKQAVRAGAAMLEGQEPERRVGLATGPLDERAGRNSELAELSERLARIAEPWGLAIDSATREAIGSLLDVRSRGRVTLDGLAQPVECWDAVRPIRIVDPEEAAGSPPAQMGRDAKTE